MMIILVFSYLALTMLSFDILTGRQYRIVIVIASFMVGIFGQTIAAIITALLGLGIGIFVIVSKDDEEEKDKIIPPKKL